MSFSFAIEQLSKHIDKFIAYSMTTVNPLYRFNTYETVGAKTEGS